MVVEETFTVKVEDGEVAGLMVAGLKAQVALAGNPEQARERVWLNPLRAAALSFSVLEPPGARVMEGMLRESE
jgi:hypothetical protein